ncbi:MAG: hypothetical protein ABSD57_11680 [Verrucomicrobiota bacterium]|jgi:hypothetical protein
MLHDSFTPIHLFIAYPSDARKEVEAAEKIIDGYNRTIKGLLGIDLIVTTWDDLKTNLRRGRGEAFQDFVNRAAIANCKIFILVGGERYGTVSRRHHPLSNFHLEVREALKLRKKSDDFVLLPFFKVLKKDKDPGSQRTGVEKIRSSLEKDDVLFHSFSDLSDFVGQFAHVLYATLISRSLLTPKVLALKRFFAFSQSPDSAPEAKDMVITYPAMDKKYMGESARPDFWKERLVPNLVFEDYKALQKIEKCLRLIRFSRFKICSTANIVANYDRMNRFWICLPRNARAQAHLNLKYSSVSKFKILELEPDRAKVTGAASNEKMYSWVNNKGETIFVQSPLNKYLGTQRANADPDAEWSSTLRDVVAKDFAILARFTDKSKVLPSSEGYLKDFFLGGLRGLGTWGAAWFLDRRYNNFEGLEKDEDTQFLLEVTYRNGRIHDVTIVSDKPQSYFDREDSDERVREVIELYKTDRL